jgi:AraC-like DNA-binding protein
MKDLKNYSGFLRFVPPSDFAQEYLFFSDAMGYLDEPGLHIRREKFNNNIIMVVCSGILHVHQNGKHFRLGQGKGILLNLEPLHEYYSDPDDPCVIIFSHLNGKGCSSLMKEVEALSSLPVEFNGEQMIEILTGCFSAVMKREENVEIAISKALYSAMMEIVGQQLQGIPAGVLPEQVFVNRIGDYVNDHVCEHITLEELAKSVNMSKYHFCRRFKEETGLTPMQYVIRRKVDASKYFLQYTGDAVQLIAERFGFTDQSHYARLFRRFTGMTPRAYRRKGQR